MAMPARRDSCAAFGVRQAVVDDFTDEDVDHSVERLAAVHTGRNELEPAQERKLMAERGHSQAEGTSQVPDAELTVRERVHDTDADGIGQCLEHFRGVAHDFVDGEGGAGRLNAPVIVRLGQILIDHMHN